MYTAQFDLMAGSVNSQRH